MAAWSSFSSELSRGRLAGVQFCHAPPAPRAQDTGPGGDQALLRRGAGAAGGLSTSRHDFSRDSWGWRSSEFHPGPRADQPPRRRSRSLRSLCRAEAPPGSRRALEGRGCKSGRTARTLVVTSRIRTAMVEPTPIDTGRSSKAQRNHGGACSMGRVCRVAQWAGAACRTWCPFRCSITVDLSPGGGRKVKNLRRTRASRDRGLLFEAWAGPGRHGPGTAKLIEVPRFRRSARCCKVSAVSARSRHRRVDSWSSRSPVRVFSWGMDTAARINRAQSPRSPIRIPIRTTPSWWQAGAPS